MVKKGFSLVEALISASILVIVLVFSVMSTTTKTKVNSTYKNSNVYRCYCANNKLESKYIVNSDIKDGVVLENNKCVFYPVQGNYFYTAKIWNATDNLYDSKENAYEYPITSFPNNKVEITLGNNDNADIVIENAIRLNNIGSYCRDTSITEEDNCNPEITGNSGHKWIQGKCYNVAYRSKDVCEENGLDWEYEATNCLNGNEVYIEW